jgi:hypothetical protein
LIPSLSTLLSGIVDYAGLFPPAALPMEEAVALYARHRRSPQRWMLARFICPAARLPEFEEAARPYLEEDAESWPLSLLGRTAGTGEEHAALLAEDLDRARDSRQRRGEAVRFEAWETGIPDVVSDPGSILEGMTKETERRGLSIPAVFLEVPAGEAERLEAVAMGTARFNAAGGPVRAGLKIRTGGVEAGAFPEPDLVAAFLTVARARGVPVKATAGLHHPVRRYAREVKATMHGFLNVFGGAALALAHDWSAAELARMLEEEDPSRFVFDGEEFSWDGRGVDVAGLRDARARLALSFGSCSFDEPVEDLEALGYDLGG